MRDNIERFFRVLGDPKVQAAMIALAATSACTRERVVVQTTQFNMPVKPDSDFRCAPEPSAAVATDEEDALYKLALRRAWIDCRDRLGAAGEVWRSTEAALARSKAIPPQQEK